MLVSLLRLATRRPLAALAALVAVAALAALSIGALVGAAADAEVAAKNPRTILGRAWFDRYPERRSDDVRLWIWFGGGIGLHDHGSLWRSTTEYFEFERRGDELDLSFLHDGEKHSVKFSITSCDEAPPFDLCLDLASSPRGPKRLYGFADDDDLAARVPWASALKRSGEARSGGR